MHMKQAGILDFGICIFSVLHSHLAPPGVPGPELAGTNYRTCRLYLNLPAENIRERADTKSFRSLFTQEQMRKRRLLPTYLQRWASTSIFFVYVCLELAFGVAPHGTTAQRCSVYLQPIVAWCQQYPEQRRHPLLSWLAS